MIATHTKEQAKRQHMVQWLMLGLSLLLFSAFIGYTLIQERHNLDRRERERLLSQVRVINDNMGRQLEAVDRTLAGIRDKLPAGRDAAAWRQTSRLLAVLCDTMPGVRTLAVIDADGKVLAINRPELLGMNVSHRDHFMVPRRYPDSATLYVSPPFKTALGTFTINLTRARIGPHDEFRGTVSAALDPEYFRVLMSSVLYAPDMHSALIHGNGRIFLTLPASSEPLEKEIDLPDSSFNRHRQSGWRESAWDENVGGERRVTALHTIRPIRVPMNTPLVVSVSRDRDAVYVNWRRNVRMQGALLALITLISFCALYFHQRRRERFDVQVAEAAAALQESEERYRSLFRNNHAVMLLIDPKTAEIVDVNPAACRFYGWSREEMTALKMDEINTLSADEIRVEMERARTMERTHFIFQHRRADGSIRDVEVYSGPVTMKQQTYLCSIVHDITERKRMEGELLRAQKLESLGILAGGIAHDFNNLMMQVQGYLDLVLLDLPAESACRRWLQTAIDGVEQTQDLTGRLITFSRGGFPVSEVLDMAELARNAVERVVPGTRVSVVFNIEPGLRPAKVDEIQMRQCFLNLATNAVEAMPEGGTLSIGMETVRIAAGDALPLQEGVYIRITFSDDGRGIRAENLPKVFDPYFTTKEMGSQKGTGLGLAVCYSVLKHHGGHIALASEPGRGTTVTLHLPALPDGPVAKEGKPQRSPEHHPGMGTAA